MMIHRISDICFWFQESSVERDDIKDPFSEVDGFSFFL